MTKKRHSNHKPRPQAQPQPAPNTENPLARFKHTINAERMIRSACGLGRLEDIEDITREAYDAGYEETLKLFAALITKVHVANNVAAENAAKLIRSQAQFRLMCVDEKAIAEWAS